ncbi:MAG: LPS export ABC transporter ATP-binding protein [bacterium]
MKIILKDLVKSYRKKRAVDGVSLDVSEGEVVGLLGPNGAGKTTTFYMIVGLVKPQEGSIFLDDTEITSLPMHLRARMGIGYLAQENSVFRNLTVRENLLLIWEMWGMSREEQERRLAVLLEDFGLTHVAQQMACSLSGGERRRVEIARALATRPRFLLLDEPFTGVDPIAVDGIQSIISTLKASGLGILITDHNVRETLAITDRAFIIRDGKILVSGTSREVAGDEVARKYYLGEDFVFEPGELQKV